MGYGEYVANRLLTSSFVLFAASIVIFSILRLVPGDPALLMLGVDATPEAIAAQRRRLGLNLPIWEQYIQWITQIIALDLGTTIQTNRPVDQLLFVRYPRSVFLAFFSISIAVLIAIPFGVISASTRTRRRTTPRCCSRSSASRSRTSCSGSS